VDPANDLPQFFVRGVCHGASIEDNYIGTCAVGGAAISVGEQLGFETSAIGLRGAASEVLDVERLHTSDYRQTLVAARMPIARPDPLRLATPSGALQQ
jgi:hypothetical protein